MRFSLLVIRVTFWSVILVGAHPNKCSYGYNGRRPHGCDDGNHDGGYGRDRRADATPIRGATHQGKPYQPSPIRGESDEEEDPRPAIPNGNPPGPFVPSGPAIGLGMVGGGNINANSLAKRQECRGGNSVFFETSTIFSNSTGQPPEPSGARAGNVIFTTANFPAAISLDGGITFHAIDPTVYSGPANPATDDGFCCDQIVQYLPSIDRFAWLIQYWENAASANKLRLITFHPQDVTTTGINSWLYVDFLSTDLGLTNILDAGELAVGNNQFYLSATNTGTGLVVMRVPIAALDVVGSFTYWYTDPNNGQVAYLSRLSQNPGDTLFWAGHSTYGTDLRVFRWPESGTTYFWTDLRINDWPSDAANFASNCPGSPTNWIFSALFGRIIGSTRRSMNEVWFAWAASSGNGFPNVHVQIAQIGVANWPNLQLLRQWQIWNPDFAFIYPALYANECGDVGVSVMFGGGKAGFNPSSAVGVINSDGVLTRTVYYPELSGTCEDRFGDYLTVRSDNGTNFEGYVYAEQATPGGGIQRNTRYVGFYRGTVIG